MILYSLVTIASNQNISTGNSFFNLTNVSNNQQQQSQSVSSSAINTVCLIAEIIASIWFTIDFILRLYSTPLKRWQFIMLPFNIIDIIINLIFLEIIVDTLAFSNSNKNWNSVARTIHILRIVRVIKASAGIKAFGYTIKKSLKELTLLITIIFSTAIFFGSLAYLVEKDFPDSEFDSLPNSYYWAIITMSTVGYGDINTKTALGKTISVITGVLGYLQFSLPVAIFTKNFNEYFVYLQKKDKTRKNIKRREAFKQHQKEFGLNWFRRKSSSFGQDAARKMSLDTLKSFLNFRQL